MPNTISQGEAIDEALEGEDDEQKADDQVALVMAELGIDLLGKETVRTLHAVIFYVSLMLLLCRAGAKPCPPPQQTRRVNSRSGWPSCAKAICSGASSTAHLPVRSVKTCALCGALAACIRERVRRSLTGK